MIKKGLTLIELMVVIAIIGILAALAFPTFSNLLAKAKRTEALVQLRSLCAAEKIFHLEHGTYTTKLLGPDSISWKPDGYRNNPAEESFYYTYGFPGTDGIQYVVGKLKTPSSYLTGAYADHSNFKIYAVGYIKGNDKPDIISIDNNGAIVVVQDALE